MRHHWLDCIRMGNTLGGMNDLRSKLPFSIAELQRRLGAKSYPSLHRAISGAKPVSVDLAKRIEAATGGAIHWTEFFSDEAQPAPPSTAA